jgi:glycosyltransferase involved in cell wall biosynthesis
MFMHRLNARGGHERSTLEILTRLSRAGWHVELVAFEADDWPAELPFHFYRVPRWHPPVQLLENLWFASYVCLWSLFHKRRGRVFVTMGVAAANGDVRVVQFLNSAYRRSVQAGIARYPNSSTGLHDLYQRFYAWWESWRERRLLPRSRHVVAISHRVGDDIKAFLGGTTPPMSVIHHGTDDTPHTVRTSEGAVSLSTDVPVILFVGALERKGIDKALRALALIQDKPWRFGVLGAGQVSRWQEYARTLGIEARVRFLGFQEMEPYWQVADILLFPSTYEPFGLVITEAASHGLIPVASSECGAMELWQDRPAWLDLSATSDDAEWAEALARLVTDQTAREELAEDAQSRFQEWDWDKATAAYARVLNGILAERTP